MKCIRCIPSSEKRCRWYNDLVGPYFLLHSPHAFEAVLNGIIAEVECRKVRLFYARFSERWVLEESVPTEYLYSLSDGAWVSRWQANRYLRVTSEEELIFNIGEREYLYFYYFALIVLMNKRLTLTPTANFASQHLQLHLSLGCVQPCTVYHNPFYLESIVDKPHHRRSQKLMPRCWDLSI